MVRAERIEPARVIQDSEADSNSSNYFVDGNPRVHPSLSLLNTGPSTSEKAKVGSVYFGPGRPLDPPGGPQTVSGTLRGGPSGQHGLPVRSL